MKAGYELNKAVTFAVKGCINKGILSDYLSKHSSEVISMLTAEWNIETAREVGLEEGIEIGREEGREKGRIEGRMEIAQKLLEFWSVNEIVQKLGLTEVEASELSGSSGSVGKLDLF